MYGHERRKETDKIRNEVQTVDNVALVSVQQHLDQFKWTYKPLEEIYDLEAAYVRVGTPEYGKNNKMSTSDVNMSWDGSGSPSEEQHLGARGARRAPQATLVDTPRAAAAESDPNRRSGGMESASARAPIHMSRRRVGGMGLIHGVMPNTQPNLIGARTTQEAQPSGSIQNIPLALGAEDRFPAGWVPTGRMMDERRQPSRTTPATAGPVRIPPPQPAPLGPLANSLLPQQAPPGPRGTADTSRVPYLDVHGVPRRWDGSAIAATSQLPPMNVRRAPQRRDGSAIATTPEVRARKATGADAEVFCLLQRQMKQCSIHRVPSSYPNESSHWSHAPGFEDFGIIKRLPSEMQRDDLKYWARRKLELQFDITFLLNFVSEDQRKFYYSLALPSGWCSRVLDKTRERGKGELLPERPSMYHRLC